MEKIFEHTLLYDYYGELLNEHQRQVYEDAVFNDLSLSEVADTYGISRQAAHDLIRRVNRILEGYEDKLHMVETFRKIEELAEDISHKADAEDISADEAFASIKQSADRIIQILE